MKNGQYKTRKHQIRAFERQVKKGKIGLAAALRDAATVGAAEERGRTLGILLEAHDLREASGLVTAVSIMEVLGYQKKGVV